MRDFIAGITLLACLFVFTVSFIALFKPLPKLKLPTRKSALKGFGVGFALFILAAIIVPQSDPASKTDAPKKVTVDASTSTASLNEASPVSPEHQKSPDQDEVISFIRNVVMQNINCKSGVDWTQDKINKMSEGKARSIDAYEEAQRGISSCDMALKEYNRGDLVSAYSFVDGNSKRREITVNAINECRLAADKRKKAMQMAQNVLDGADGLANVSKYKSLRNDALNDETACRMNLMGLAEMAGVPAKDVEFASVDRMWK